MLKEMWKYSKFEACYFVGCLVLVFIMCCLGFLYSATIFTILALNSMTNLDIYKLKLRCRQLEEENLVMMESYNLLTGKVLEQAEEILERVSRLKGGK